MNGTRAHVSGLLLTALLLSGCMTQQGGQQSEFGQAMMNGLAQGLLSGAGASLGQGIATGSKRHLAVAAAQAALGTAATAAATSARGAPAPHAAPAPGSGSTPRSTSYSTGPEGYPNTPQCRAMMQYIKSGAFNRDSEGHPAYGLERLYKMEHACLASVPTHPLSRRKACGNGLYYHHFNDRHYCGWRKALAAARRWEATNIRGMPARQYLSTYGLPSLFR